MAEIENPDCVWLSDLNLSRHRRFYEEKCKPSADPHDRLAINGFRASIPGDVEFQHNLLSSLPDPM